MTEVTTHEDEGIRICRCSCKARQVTDVVAWCIQEVK